MGEDTSTGVTAVQQGAQGEREDGRSPRLRYQERLYLSWWGWPLPLGAAALLAAEAHMGYPGIQEWLPYAIMLPLALAMLLALGRVTIRITRGSVTEGSVTESDRKSDADSDNPESNTEDELWVGTAHIPLRHLGQVEVIDRQHKRKALGPHLDPAAFVSHRGWIGPVLRVEVTDPHDPTPYWLFSTRKPERLAALLIQRH